MGSHKTSERRHTDPQIEDRLDQELEQTFPASDAPQITRDPPPHSGEDRRPRRPAVKHKTN